MKFFAFPSSACRLYYRRMRNSLQTRSNPDPAECCCPDALSLLGHRTLCWHSFRFKAAKETKPRLDCTKRACDVFVSRLVLGVPVPPAPRNAPRSRIAPFSFHSSSRSGSSLNSNRVHRSAERAGRRSPARPTTDSDQPIAFSPLGPLLLQGCVWRLSSISYQDSLWTGHPRLRAAWLGLCSSGKTRF